MVTLSLGSVMEHYIYQQVVEAKKILKLGSVIFLSETRTKQQAKNLKWVLLFTLFTLL